MQEYCKVGLSGRETSWPLNRETYKYFGDGVTGFEFLVSNVTRNLKLAT